MRSRMSLLLGAMLLLAACHDGLESPPTAPGFEPEAPRFSLPAGRQKARVIVQLRSQADQAPVAHEVRGRGGRVIREFRRFPFLALEVNENALQGLLRSPRVVAISEDRASAPALDSTLNVIGADKVHSILGWDGSGTAVVILDTGIDAAHPFVSGRVVEEACFSTTDDYIFSLCPNLAGSMTGPGAASIYAPLCQNGGDNLCVHGLHVAGIAAGSNAGGFPAAGVAPGADIIAIQVFSRINDIAGCHPDAAPCVKSYLADQMAAFEHVIGLMPQYNIAAINMSVGAGNFTAPCDNDPLAVFIGAMWVANVATVIGAANDGRTGVGYPGCISTAVTVGASNNQDQLASFSNRGPLLDLLAPGAGVVSAIPGGYGAKDGTSMAAPHVTGAYALMRQAYPNMHIHQILTTLRQSGVPITYETMSGNVTTRRIDLAAALGAPATLPPVLTVKQPKVTVNEGSSITNTGTVMDPDGDPVTLSASVGFVFDSGDGTWLWTYAATDGPGQTQTVTITAADGKGGEGAVIFSLEVNNVAPDVDVSGNAKLISGEAFGLTGTFADPGAADGPWQWLIDWGGQSRIGGSTSVQDAPIQASHTFCAPGDFRVRLWVSDKDGGTGADSLTLTVEYVGVTIDISPTERPNPIKLSSRGMLAVALLGTASFDAGQADAASIVLGDGVGTDTRVARRPNGSLNASREDVNGDGLPDLVLHFRVADLVANGDLTAASTQLVLSGVLGDACTSFRGADSVIVLP